MNFNVRFKMFWNSTYIKMNSWAQKLIREQAAIILNQVTFI